MSTVYIGGASIDEKGGAHGGKAGNQTGRELKKQAWYLHSKGWRVFRAKEALDAAAIARCMRMAIANRHIGYDQYQRNTLYAAAEPLGFDVSKVAVDCETDCSALVRVCCAYAGIRGLPSGFRTGNEPDNLLKTGRFTELTGSRYQTRPDALRAGDILCTAVSGHTVVVLNDGPGAGDDPRLPEGLAVGDFGSAVARMQEALLAWRADCLPRWGADGDFGGETEAALKDFQRSAGLPATGVYDAASREALAAARGDAGEAKRVLATGDVNVRDAPGTDARILGVLRKGQSAPWRGVKLEWGGRDWYQIGFAGGSGWVSGRYSRIEA